MIIFFPEDSRIFCGKFMDLIEISGKKLYYTINHICNKEKLKVEHLAINSKIPNEISLNFSYVSHREREVCIGVIRKRINMWIKGIDENFKNKKQLDKHMYLPHRKRFKVLFKDKFQTHTIIPTHLPTLIYDLIEIIGIVHNMLDTMPDNGIQTVMNITKCLICCKNNHGNKMYGYRLPVPILEISMGKDCIYLKQMMYCYFNGKYTIGINPGNSNNIYSMRKSPRLLEYLLKVSVSSTPGIIKKDIGRHRDYGKIENENISEEEEHYIKDLEENGYVAILTPWVYSFRVYDS